MSICATCGKDHEAEQINLDIKVTTEELTELKLLINRIDCATQALSPAVVSANASEQQVKLFISATIEMLAVYKEMQSQWWTKVKAKYFKDRAENVYVNFVTGDLYLKKDEVSCKC